LLSMSYSGPPNIVPFAFRISSAPDQDAWVDSKVGGPDCQINHLFSSTLSAWNRHYGSQPYRLGAMSVGMAANPGDCGVESNYTGSGELVVSYVRSDTGQAVTRRFVRPCHEGLIYVCVGDLLDAAVEDMNGGASSSL
jgi:hypothetical protein